MSIVDRDQIKTLLADVVSAEAVDCLFDRRVGIITNLVYDNDAHEQFDLHLFRADIANASIVSTEGDSVHFARDSQYASAAGFSYKTALTSAVCEAIERYCAITYSEARILIGNPNQLAYKPIVLEDLAFYTYQKSLNPDWPHVAFDPEASRGWIEGIELATGDQVSVPAELALLAYRPRTPHERFSQGISTGLAAGPNWKAAALTGLLEVVERDAFMSTWLLKRPLDTGHPSVDAIKDHHRALVSRPHVDTHIGLCATDHGFPSAIAIVASRSGTGFVASAAAHLHADTAAQKALIGAQQMYCGAWLKASRADYKPVDDPHEIKKFSDHRSYYLKQDNETVFNWLLSANCQRPNNDTCLASADVFQVGEYLRQLGLEAYAVDLTLPEIAEMGLCVVRTVIPSMQPLYCGRNTRVTNLERLRSLAGDDTLSIEDLNPAVHPFA